MKRILTVFAVLSVAALMPARGFAVNLLTNGDLNLTTPGENFDLPLGWDLRTNPNSLGPEPAPRFPAFQASYAEHTNPGGAGTMGLVFNSTEGNYPGYEFEGYDAVDGDLTQTVAGTPGQKYKMTGWAYFEGGYAGGVDNLAANSPSTRAGLPSLTNTYFFLEFLDAGNALLVGGVALELKAAGQVNNPDMTETTRNWLQHTLTGVAPPGTVGVRVRALMEDGEFNIDMPHQAAWVDDFSLEAVPEPATWLLGLLGLAVIGAVRRTRQ